MNESTSGTGNVSGDMAAAAAALSARSPLRAKDGVWADLVRRVGLADQMALAGLYDETASLVFGLALKMLGDAADAEEVSADVYAQVWRTAAAFDVSRGSVATWLLMLTRSRAIDRIRSRAERRKREHGMEEQFEAVDPGLSPDATTALSEQRRRVRLALAALPVDQRRLIEQAFFSGKSHAELAEETGVPLGTVKTRIRLGLMKLRERLVEEGAA